MYKLSDSTGVLGITNERLRATTRDDGYRLVYVHTDVREWLEEALGAINEQHFGQLVGALVGQLVDNYNLVSLVMETLMEKPDPRGYFENAGEPWVSVSFVAIGRASSIERYKLAHILTTFALKWKDTYFSKE